jgi:hypothetical protein
VDLVYDLCEWRMCDAPDVQSGTIAGAAIAEMDADILRIVRLPLHFVI